MTLNHPSEHDIDSLIYNDAYFETDDDVSSKFDDIIMLATRSAFVPVNTSTGTSERTNLTFTDPIGEYMEVKSVDSVLLFGQKYDVVESNGTYSFAAGSVVKHPIYGTEIDLNTPIDGKLPISITLVKGSTTQTLTVVVDGGILPIRCETIEIEADGTIKYATNKDSVEALPLRVLYTVGLQSSLKKADGSYDLSSVSGHRNPDGTLSFFTNYYSGEGLPHYGYGDATVTFTPSSENRYYYFQRNRIIYKNGINGGTGEGDLPAKMLEGSNTFVVDESKLGTGAYGTFDFDNRATVADLQSAIDAGNPDKPFYLIIDYFRPTSGGKGEYVYHVVERTAAELVGSVTTVSAEGVMNALGVTVNGNFAVTKTGYDAPRLGRLTRLTRTKTENPFDPDTASTNYTGTSDYSFAPFYGTSHGEEGEGILPGSQNYITVHLGNNGKLTIKDGSLFVTKTLDMAEGLSTPDGTFTFEVTATGSTSDVTIQTYNRNEDTGDWDVIEGSSETLAFTSGKATFNLKGNQAALISGLPTGTNVSVTESDTMPTNANGTFAFKSVSGHTGNTNATISGKTASATLQASVQTVIEFVNTYTTSTSLDTDPNKPGNQSFPFIKEFYTVTKSTAADGTTIEERVARNYSAGDDFSFRVDAANGAPMPKDAQGNQQNSITLSGADFTGTNQMSGVFGELSFTEPGTYYYTIREVRPDSGGVQGVTYGPTSYGIEVTVEEDQNTPGKLTASITGLQKYANANATGTGTPITPVDLNQIVFTNTYSETEVGRTIQVQKDLEGRKAEVNEFQFQLTAEGSYTLKTGDSVNSSNYTSFDNLLVTDSDQLMPDDTIIGNRETGWAQFETVTFTLAQAGATPTLGKLYKYSISEVVPTGATLGADGKYVYKNVTYDNTTNDLYVHVFEDGAGHIDAVVYGTRSYTFHNTYEASATLDLSGVKNLDGRPFNSGETFSFHVDGSLVSSTPATAAYAALIDLDSDIAANADSSVPMPSGVDGSGNVSSSTAGAGASSAGINFGKITFTEDDIGKTYAYTLTEASGNASGMSYDRTPRTIQVSVQYNSTDGNLKLVVSNTSTSSTANTVTLGGSDTAKTASVNWTNRYSVRSVQLDPLTGTKNLDGKPANEVFTFDVQWELDGDPSVRGTYTTTNTSGGRIANLLPNSLDKAGTYHFDVTEHNGGGTTYNYDDTQYRITLVVVDTDGTLTERSRTIEVLDGSSWVAASSGIVFNNTYRDGKPVEPPVEPEVPEDPKPIVVTLYAEKKMAVGSDAYDGMFTFRVTPEAVNPASDPVKGPLDVRGGVGTITLFSGTYTEVGDYYYTVQELHDEPNTVSGMEYDSAVYEVCIHVSAEGVGAQLSATIEIWKDGTPAEEIVFTNEYHSGDPENPTPEEKSTSVILRGKKVLENQSLASRMFQFTLTGVDVVPMDEGGAAQASVENVTPTLEADEDKNDEDEDAEPVTPDEGEDFGEIDEPGEDETSNEVEASGEVGSLVEMAQLARASLPPMPDGVTGNSVTVSNTGNIFQFGRITYSEPGIYKYTITEERGDGEYIYATTVYEVNVVVEADETGKLSATVFTGESRPWEDRLDDVVFTNTYTGEQTPEEAQAPSITKSTGRGSSTPLKNGETIYYSIRVVNPNAFDLVNVTVEDHLNRGLTNSYFDVGGISVVPSGTSYTPSLSLAGDVLSLDIGTLPANTEIDFVIPVVVVVGSNISTTLSNTAKVLWEDPNAPTPGPGTPPETPPVVNTVWDDPSPYIPPSPPGPGTDPSTPDKPNEPDDTEEIEPPEDPTVQPPGPGEIVPFPDYLILDELVPLAAPHLNITDHYAYIIGYSDGMVKPTGSITRAEVATIFFRLMQDDYRAANWSTENSFSDVDSSKWYNNAISTCAKAGLLSGYPDGTFRPNAEITRAEFAAIASRFLSTDAPGYDYFTDTVGHWAYKEVARAVYAGWLRGDGRLFRPDEKINRAETVTVVNRMINRFPDKDHLLADMIRWPDNTVDMWYYEDIQEATNSHDYEGLDASLFQEVWSVLLPNRDWAALEKQWADAYAAPGGEVAPDLIAN